jgi:4-hydroxybenzoyl-CoA thioesterase/acyl-CoA thioester hydrolase
MSLSPPSARNPPPDDPPMPRLEPLRREDLRPGLWSTEVAIRFGHCDPAGIVYTPHYFDMFNGVIEQFYPSALGIDYYALIRERRLGPGYGHAACDFFAPSLMGEVMEVAVAVERIGRASYTLILHAMKADKEAVRGRFVTVMTSLDSFRTTPIPDDVRASLETYQARCRVGASAATHSKS